MDIASLFKELNEIVAPINGGKDKYTVSLDLRAKGGTGNDYGSLFLMRNDAICWDRFVEQPKDIGHRLEELKRWIAARQERDREEVVKLAVILGTCVPGRAA